MLNLQIRQFRASLIAMTNANPLPMEVKRLVFAEVHTQIDMEAEKMIVAELEEAKDQNKGTEGKEDNADEQSVQSD